MNVKPQPRHLRWTSPVGALVIVAEGPAITQLHIHSEDGKRAFALAAAGVQAPEDPLLVQALSALQAYFSGAPLALPPLRPAGTDFQRQVWAALAQLPAGQTCSYGQLAQRVGRPTAARAVGGAVGKNPIPIFIPCHRVIGASGALTGFAHGLPVKRALLALEGMG